MVLLRLCLLAVVAQAFESVVFCWRGNEIQSAPTGLLVEYYSAQRRPHCGPVTGWNQEWRARRGAKESCAGCADLNAQTANT
jgi:hypothetical protein